MPVERPRADRPSGRTRPERFVDRIRRQRIDLLLDVTAQLLAERGPARLRVEDVAEEAGVAKGTVYTDFDSKSSLLRATVERCRQRFLDAFELRIAEAEGAEARLEALLDTLATMAVEEPHLTALLRRSIPDGLDGAEQPSMYREIEEYVHRIMVEARAEGALGADLDPQLAAQATLALSVLPSLIRVGIDEGPGPIARALRRTLDQLRV